VFTARYGLSPYITQISLVFNWLTIHDFKCQSLNEKRESKTDVKLWHLKPNAYNIKVDMQEVGSGYRMIRLRTEAGVGVLVNSGMKTCFNYQLNTQFLYSIAICKLHYNPRHVSSISTPIFRRTNCIITVSGIVTV
jgi:hypothetical protein